MDYQATQSLPAIRSAIVNGDLPWDNEEVFDQWVRNFAELIRAEASLAALSTGLKVAHLDKQDAHIREAFRRATAKEDT